MSASAPFPYAGEAAALVSSVLWAGSGIVFRRMKGRVPAAALNLAKNTTGAAGFTVVLLLAGGRAWPTEVPLKAQGWLAVSGFLGLTVCDTLLLRAMLEIGPRRATLLLALAPVLIFAAALAPPFSQTEALARPATWLGAVLALSGIALAASEAPDGAGDPALVRRGVRDALFASFFQAAGVLLARLGFQEGAGPVEGAQIRLAVGSLGLVVAGAALGTLPGWWRAVTSPGTLRVLATTAFFGTFLGIGLNQCGLAWAASTGAASTINSLAPVWLIPLSALFLGERHAARAWVSTALALGGVALLTL